MAPLDLARARRLAECDRRRMPQGLRPGNDGPPPRRGRKDSAPRGARERLRIARAFVPGQPGESRSMYDITSIAGVLLPVAERIDPGSSTSTSGAAWRCDEPNPWETNPSGRPAQADVQLAMMLARYDRAIAASLVEPLALGGRRAARISRARRAVRGGRRDRPEMGRRARRSAARRSRLEVQNPKNSARLAVATVLGRAGDQRFRHLQHSFLYLWVPDIEDINPYD